MLNVRIISFAFALWLCSLGIYGQSSSVQQQIEANANPISHLSDWDGVLREHADAQFIFLGEQRHGDAASFKVKQQIVERLHQAYDFDIIVFESDFVTMYHDYLQYRAGETKAANLLPGNIALSWKYCPQFQPIFNYIIKTQSTSRPLIPLGMDVGASFRRIDSAFVADLFEYLDENQLQYAPILIELFHTILDKNQHQVDYADLLLTELTQIKAQMEKLELTDDYYYQAIYSLIEPYDRDRHMAENLLWLQKQYPDKKFIVWSHNDHFIDTEPTVSPHHMTIIDHLEQHVDRDKIWTIGLTSYGGIAGGELGLEDYAVATPAHNSIEHFMQRSHPSANYIYANLASIESDAPYLMKANNHDRQALGKWHQHFNAVLLVQQMMPCQ